MTAYTDLMRQITKIETKIELGRASSDDIEFYFEYVRALEAQNAEHNEPTTNPNE